MGILIGCAVVALGAGLLHDLWRDEEAVTRERYFASRRRWRCALDERAHENVGWRRREG